MAYRLLLICAGLLVMGCQRAPVSLPPFGVSNDYQWLPGQPGPGLVADPGSPIPDVPRPIGFKVLTDRSDSSFDGVARTVHHVYQGLGSAGEAVAFYRQQLQTDGWTATGMHGGATEKRGADIVLTYTKGAEDLHVAIGTRGNVTTLVIDIAPRGSLGQAPSAAAQ